ncbi:MAG: peptidase A2A [Chloroflexi bacterium]|nr:MAG: peptidase A2A [Chloroflexota bacterium]HDN79357.1 peptidase A2A [Chloroflexota bacterium]
MRIPISVPIVIRNVKITGPEGWVGVDLILDTGAAFVSLPWAVLKVIGYDPAIVPDRQEIITANGVIEVPKLRVKSIEMGDIKAYNVEVICHDIPELAGVQGLLGLSFLKCFKVILDFRESVLEIT